MCDTALARLCPNKEGLYLEFHLHERLSSGGELWTKKLQHSQLSMFPMPSVPLTVLSFSTESGLSSDTVHKNKPRSLFWNGIAQIFSLGNETMSI